MNSVEACQSAIESELVNLVEKIVRESGNPVGFDAKEWVIRWLGSPHHALGGQLPKTFLNTLEGRDLVVSLILRIQSGSFS